MREIAEKRKVSELLALYSLEPGMRDIYVEGINDYLIIERFLLKYDIKDFRIIEVDSINFEELYDNYPEIKRNNKKKLTKLSILLEHKFKMKLKKVCCIVDKDHDEFLDELISNNYLFYTDFTSFEMYMFNSDCLRIFYKNTLRNFPIPPGRTIKELQKVLKEQFLIGLAIIRKDQIKNSETITDIKKSVIIDKNTGTVRFEMKIHLQKILHNNHLDSQLNDYVTCIEKDRNKCGNDSRNHIRGHDFIHLFFHLMICCS